MPTEFSIILLTMLGIFIVSIVLTIIQWSRNNAMPQTSVEAQVVAIPCSGWFDKSGVDFHFKIDGICEVKFLLLSSGKRRTIKVPIDELEVIAKGDVGILTLQGSRYISFKRQQ